MTLLQHRFNDFVVPVPEAGCHLWLGYTAKSGYGYLPVDGAPMQAHRYAWEQEHGPIPDGVMVRHKCDVRSCVNCGHLLLGVAADNSADMVARNRSCRGDRNRGAKLEPETIAAVRAAVGTVSEIANKLGVSRTHVWNLRNGKRRENA